MFQVFLLIFNTSIISEINSKDKIKLGQGIDTDFINIKDILLNDGYLSKNGR